jgi:flagellar M-ring protein FliF
MVVSSLPPEKQADVARRIAQMDRTSPDVIKQVEKEPGSIVYGDSSLAVTFIKNVVYNEDECKKLGYLDNMTWEQFKSQNTQPVAQTVDQTWIDLISAGTGIDSANISVLAYQRPWFEDSTSGSVFTRVTFWLQIALAAIILGILVFVIIRSARPLTVEETEPELSVEQMLAATKENQPAVDDIDMQDKSETRKAIEKFVDENPEAVALLLRNWLNDDWS